jgi:hypothetical protein
LLVVALVEAVSMVVAVGLVVINHYLQLQH